MHLSTDQKSILPWKPNGLSRKLLIYRRSIKVAISIRGRLPRTGPPLYKSYPLICGPSQESKCSYLNFLQQPERPLQGFSSGKPKKIFPGGSDMEESYPPQGPYGYVQVNTIPVLLVRRRHHTRGHGGVAFVYQ